MNTNASPEPHGSSSTFEGPDWFRDLPRTDVTRENCNTPSFKSAIDSKDFQRAYDIAVSGGVPVDTMLDEAWITRATASRLEEHHPQRAAELLAFAGHLLAVALGRPNAYHHVFPPEPSAEWKEFVHDALAALSVAAQRDARRA